MSNHALQMLFDANSIAIITSASEQDKQIGNNLLRDLLKSKETKQLFLVQENPPIIENVISVSSLSELTQTPECVIIVAPSIEYKSILEECVKLNITLAVLFISEYDINKQTERELIHFLNVAKETHQLRVIGLTSFGLYRPSCNIRLSKYSNKIQSGKIAFVGHSGSLCSIVTDWSTENGIGFSCIMSLDDKLNNVDFTDIINFLAEDPETEAIILQLHHEINGQKLISTLRWAAKRKTVIVLQLSDTTEQAENNNEFHVADLVSHNEIFSYAMQRIGVIQIYSVDQIFEILCGLHFYQKINNNKLLILGNSYSFNQITANRNQQENNSFAKLTEKTISNINERMPQIHIKNPLYIPKNTNLTDFLFATRACLNDINVNGVLAMVSSHCYSDDEYEQLLDQLAQLQTQTSKPLLLCISGKNRNQIADKLLEKYKVFIFKKSSIAINVFSNLYKFSNAKHCLLSLQQQSYSQPKKQSQQHVDIARNIIAKQIKQKQYILSEYISKKILSCFQIECNYTALANSIEDAEKSAKMIGFPVALKIDSPDILHKSQLGCVRLNIRSCEELQHAYKYIMEHANIMVPHAKINGVSIQSMLPEHYTRKVKISAFRDKNFGSVIVFSMKDDSFSNQNKFILLPPLSLSLINDIIQKTRIDYTLSSYQNMIPIDKTSLQNVLSMISECILQLPEILELKIDLCILQQGVIASDVRMIVGQYIPQNNITHFAFTPYPNHLKCTTVLTNGETVNIEPIQEIDAVDIQNFVINLSDTSRFNRFMINIKELSLDTLCHCTQLDYSRDMGFLMRNNNGEIIAIAHYFSDALKEKCEFSITVSDNQQRKGIGVILMEYLCKTAKQYGFKTIYGEILSDNIPMLTLAQKVGFTILDNSENEQTKYAVKEL